MSETWDNKNEKSIVDNIRNNEYVADKLKDYLSLKYYPVAIKFFINKEDILTNIKRINKKLRHCEMVKKASEGETFYGTSDDQLCKGGSASLGLEEVPKKIKTGEFYHNLKRFKSIGSAKRTLDEIPKIDFESYAIAYAPLQKAEFQPDIIILITNPKQAMIITQAVVYTLGGRVNADFAGIQSVCADIVAGPYTKKVPNISLACSGSRKFAKIEDEELVIGLNGENINCLVTALESVVNS